MAEETKNTPKKVKKEKKKIVPTKTPMSEQPPEIRIHNFDEVPRGYSAEQAMSEAQRCIQCAKPGCTHACPVEINVPAFLEKVAEGDFQAAVNVIKETNSLPAITGRVCPQENQCEGGCVLCKRFESVSIGRLERFVADWEAEHGAPSIPNIPEWTGKKVAVVGSGPAGLTAAADLAKLGHHVTIFEALHEAGGVLIYGIPEFRLPKSIVRREIDYICEMGVKLVKDFVVGSSATVDELLNEFDAIFLGTGAGLPWFPNIPGENLNGVYSANEYLTRANLMKAYKASEDGRGTPIGYGDTVVTIGAGNVAMDSARTARRMGAKRSIIMYRRSKDEMPARAEEIHHAEEEGIEFMMLTSPVAIHGENQVESIECIKNELGEPDASGRRRPVAVEGSNFMVPANLVIIAIGQSPSPLVPKSTPDLEIGRKKNIVVQDTTMKTSKQGVFAGGDAATGGATVILAMGQGKQAARAIDEYLTTGEW